VNVPGNSTAPETGRAQAQLAIEGIHCGACVQLIEMRVAALPGVLSVTVSQVTHRARVVWDGARASLQDVLAAVAGAGYRAWPVSAGINPQQRSARRRELWRLFVAGFAMMQLMMYAFPAYIAGEGDLEPGIDVLLKLAGFVITLPVLLFSAAPFFRGALRDMRLRRVGMDVPVALAIAVTFLYSTWTTFLTPGPVYYDSLAMFVFLLLGGRWLEALARERAASAIEELARMQPARAQRFANFPASRETQDVAVEELQPADMVLVAPGAACPADGTVLEGSSLNDEALLTGESAARRKQLGDAVHGGALNLTAPLVLRITATGADSRLATIVRMVEQGAAQKPRLLELADRHAGWFLGAVLAIALISGVAWTFIDPARAVWIAMAVLIVTCPCALSLAAPLAMSAAVGRLARRGVLVTRGHALETLARADCFAFDKTGTLTTGRMRVHGAHLAGRIDRATLDRLAGELERGSAHPLAQALAMMAAPALRNAAPLTVEDWREVPGGGVEARVNGVRTRIGSIAFVEELHHQPFEAAWEYGEEMSLAALGDERGWLGVYALGDGVREGARELVQALDQAGCRTALLTGDHPAAAWRVAQAAGISEVQSSQGPQDKLAWVQEQQDEGAVLAMVGDGINDAPVLAQAHVSIAMGSGAPLAQARSDMVLMSARPADLWEARRVATLAMRIVRQNLAWAAAYNLVAIPLAAFGWLNPWLAGLGMAGSSLLVVGNSLRLLQRRRMAPVTDAPGLAIQPA
jgi:Cu2+-exporting ATPase